MLKRNKLFLSVLLAILVSLKSYGACSSDPARIVYDINIFLSTIKNMFPLKLGGVTAISGGSPESYNSLPDIPSSPLCVCMNPFPRIGLTLNYWEVAAIVETVKDPYCFPGLGLYLPLGINSLASGTEQQGQGGHKKVGDDKKFIQFNAYTFNPIKYLQLFLDSVCFNYKEEFFYMSVVDFFWNDDMWSLVVNPECVVLSSPPAQIACNFVDSAAVAANKMPIDVLYWCMGSHAVCPLTGSIKSNNLFAANAAGLEKGVYSLHRKGILWGWLGSQALCGPYYQPIWKKTAYNKQVIFPVPHPNRVPVGYQSMLYDKGKNPYVGSKADNFAWFLYRYRSCCAF